MRQSLFYNNHMADNERREEMYSVLIDEKSTQSNQTTEEKLVRKMRTPAKLERKKYNLFFVG